MYKRSLVAATLTLLLAGCSTHLEVPHAAVTTSSENASVTSDEVNASATDSAQANSTLDAFAPLTAQSTGPGYAKVRADGTLLIDNQIMFPMGFYHVSWAGNAAQRMRDLKAIAELGFNAMNATMFDPEEDLAGYRALLDEAQARGMKLMVEDFNATSINAFKNHPAVLGWMVADDCNNLVTPEELQRRSANARVLDSNHLTYTSMAISLSNSHSSYFGKADAIGNQSYPVDGGDPVGVVYPVMKTLVAQSAANGTLPIANLQSFRWPNGRYPTPKELNSMTNQALGAGVKGILYYTYLDKTNNLATYTALNSELKRLATEVKQLSPVLLNGARTELSTSSPIAQARANLWAYQGHRYLQVVSLSDTQGQKVKVTLPTGATQLVPLFANRPSGMTVNANQVSGTLAALSTHWYEVK